MDSEQAQATVETVALLPALLILAVAAWQGLVIGWTAVEAQPAGPGGGPGGGGGGAAGPRHPPVAPRNDARGRRASPLRPQAGRQRPGAGHRARVSDVALRVRRGGGGVRREQGQASIELVVAAMGTALAVLAVVQLLLVAAARQRALRVAGQAAVLAAQGRAIPQGLRTDADIAVRGRVVTVTVIARGV